MSSLAVLSNGEVKAWGYNPHGALGTGLTTSRILSPQRVVINQRVKKVNGGYYHSLFITESGELFAAGRNQYGELCVGDTDSRNLPVPIVNSKDFHVIQARPGNSAYTWEHITTIFLTTQGEVFSCGRAIGRSTDTVPAHSPGKVEDMGVVSSITKGFDADNNALSTDGVLFSWSSRSGAPILPSPVTETSKLKVGKVYSGSFHWFVQETINTDISGNDDSSIEIAGKLENRLEFPLLFNVSISIPCTGVLSSYRSLKFNTSLDNSGIIKVDDFLQLDSSVVLALNGGSLEAKHVVVQQYASVTGRGSIFSTVFNYGTIKPTGVLEIQKDLVIAQNSNVLLSYNNNTQLIVKGILSVNGSFVFTFPNSIPSNYTISLVLFGSLLSEHDSFKVQCDHVLTIHDFPGHVIESGQCPSPLKNVVYLVVPLNNSNDILWSRNDIWVPSPPNENSTVIIDGNYINQVVFIDQNVIIKSLHLTNVVISIDCSSITVNGFTSFIDSSIESTCDNRSEFTSLTYEFIGVTKLSGINLIVLEFGKLIEPQLTLVDAKVIVKEDATVVIDQKKRHHHS
ncbi:hypothetical protein GEMRC1_007242 [Eukaryota sp. GEM-RC1]